jgi:uncharacterized protein (TIGR02145 family)
MSKNLDVITFRNGESIPQAKDKVQWKYFSDNNISAWCYYEFDENNGKKYGKLYNWYAVNDARGLAPKGYHVPYNHEWKILVDFLGGVYNAGKKMKSIDGWKNGGNGDNSSGFNGLPGGLCYNYDGNFEFIGGVGYWWSSSEANPGLAWRRSLDYIDSSVGSYDEDQGIGFSVRCLKN